MAAIREGIRRMLVWMIARGGAETGGEISRAMCREYSGVMDSLKRCADLGLVKSDGSRGKSKLWEITDAGRVAAAEVPKTKTERMRDYRAGLKANAPPPYDEDDEADEVGQVRTATGIRNFISNRTAEKQSPDSIVAQAIRTQPTSVFDLGVRRVN